MAAFAELPATAGGSGQFGLEGSTDRPFLICFQAYSIRFHTSFPMHFVFLPQADGFFPWSDNSNASSLHNVSQCVTARQMPNK